QFGERLRTVISQLLERQQYRGSPQMLDFLVDQVSQQAQQDRPRFAWKRLALPWAVALCFLAVAGGLWGISAADSRRLLARFVRPTTDVAPVTSTQIRVDPGNDRTLRGKTLVVHAHVKNLLKPGVVIVTSNDGQSWTRIAMLPDR